MMKKYRVHLLMHKVSCVMMTFCIIFFTTDRAVETAVPQSSNTVVSSPEKLHTIPAGSTAKMTEGEGRRNLQRQQEAEANELEGMESEEENDSDPLLESNLLDSSAGDDERNEDEDNEELDQDIISLGHEEE